LNRWLSGRARKFAHVSGRADTLARPAKAQRAQSLSAPGPDQGHRCRAGSRCPVRGGERWRGRRRGGRPCRSGHRAGRLIRPRQGCRPGACRRRSACALAARANFSTDRISDAQLLADAIAAQTFHSIIGEHLHVAVAVEPRQVQLHVGPLPLPAGHSDEALVDSVLGELAPVIERLADDHSLAPAGPASMLALQLLDRR